MRKLSLYKDLEKSLCMQQWVHHEGNMALPAVNMGTVRGPDQ